MSLRFRSYAGQWRERLRLKEGATAAPIGVGGQGTKTVIQTLPQMAGATRYCLEAGNRRVK